MRTLIHRIHRARSWWRARQAIRAWRNLPPQQQLIVWARMLDDSPDLRALFRDALRVKGREEISAPPVRRRGRG
ncbi:MAG: hypothetical protein AB7O67_16605 [Vicinamibacterales bacterium]